VVIDGKAVRGGDVLLVNAIAQPSQRLLARIFHKAPDFSPPAGFLGKNRFGSRHFFCSAAQQGAIASYVKQKGRF
jgi:hypothetical protein